MSFGGKSVLHTHIPITSLAFLIISTGQVKKAIFLKMTSFNSFKFNLVLFIVRQFPAMLTDIMTLSYIRDRFIL